MKNDILFFSVNMSLPGLPPLPKSLVAPAQTHAITSVEQHRGISPIQRQPATLDTQLAILRREMVSFNFYFKLLKHQYSISQQNWCISHKKCA